MLQSGSWKGVLWAVTTIILISLLATMLPIQQGGVPTAHADAGGFSLNSTSFGPNERIAIDLGTLDRGCDFIYTTSDIYVVPRGSAVNGANLKALDPSGAPNTIVSGMMGGGIVDETIGYTFPSGKIGAGDWDVVEDVCQDGTFDAGEDSVLSPGFSVVIPVNIPLLPSAEIAAAKKNAGIEALKWQIAGGIVGKLFDLKKKAEKKLCKAGVISACFINGLEAPFIGPLKKMVKLTIANQVSHYKGIEADPPDPNYQQVVELASITPVISEDSSPINVAAADFANATAETDALSEAIIHTMERYQGAQAASDPGWAMRHAQSLKTYSNMLAGSLSRQSTAASQLKAAPAAEGAPSLQSRKLRRSVLVRPCHCVALHR